MSKAPNKADVYARRTMNSIFVPMEVDSDSDFVPGPVRDTVDTSKKHTRTKKNGAKSRSNIPLPFLLSSDEEDDAPSLNGTRKKATNSRVKGAKKTKAEMINDNPLLAYFVDKPHLFGAAEDAGVEAVEASKRGDSKEEEEEEEEEEEDDASGSGSQRRRKSKEPVALKSMAGSEKKVQPSPVPAAARDEPAGEESVTESSSHDEAVRPAVGRPTPMKQEESVTESSTDDGRPATRITASNAPPRQRSRSCSTTESSTHDEDEKPVAAGTKRVAKQNMQRGTNKRPKLAASETEDSTTEPGSDEELLYIISPERRPRPAFPDAPKPIGPHVLDKRERIWIPNAMNRFLRPYQRDGAQFFYRQYKAGAGGVLGDDMGLGKTIQVIAFLSAIMGKTGLKEDRYRRKEHVLRLQDRPDWRRNMPPANATWPTALIAAPTSVIENWAREFAKWGYFEVGVYTPNLKKEERSSLLHDFRLGRLDVLIVSHNMLRTDIDLFDNLALSCVFLDEAHVIKREDAGLTQAVSRIHCRRRFALTGTLIQNSYMEMWSVLDFANPGKLGSKRQWKSCIVKPLTVGQSASATDEQRRKQDEIAEILTKVILPQFFLRRTKDLIKDQLPKKVDEVVFCPLAPLQRLIYKRILALPEVQNLILKDERCTCGSRKARKQCCHPFEPESLFMFMHILIACANHVALLLPGPNDSKEQVERYSSLNARVMDGICDLGGGRRLTFGLAIMRSGMCGKWDILRALLKEWRKDPTNKVLIFTKSLKLLEMLEFQMKLDMHNFRKLDGSVPQKDRMVSIDEFNEDPDVFAFLISTLAGGTGINLTGANKVVIFDPNWNPAHDLQAMDRAFRFGQTRDVSVYRLLGGGSLEELVYARQLYKQQQMAIGYDASAQTRYFDGVQGDPQKQGELFGIKNMFTYHEDEQTMKVAIERATIAELDFAMSHPNKPAKDGDGKRLLGKDEKELRGLGAFMFDDLSPKKKQSQPQTAEERILRQGGVTYTHRNDELVKGAPRKSLAASAKPPAKQKPRASTSKGKAKYTLASDPDWPPKGRRAIHQAKAAARAAGIPYVPPTSGTARQEAAPYGQRILAKYETLVALGLVTDQESLAGYAREFEKETQEQKEKILARLDEFEAERLSQHRAD